MSSQGCNVFLATSLEHGPARRECEEQDMCQQWVARSSFEQMIGDGAITDTATIATYALLRVREAN